MKNKFNRRGFIGIAAMAGAGAAFGGLPQWSFAGLQDGKPAILGGEKAYTAGFASWPVFDTTEEQALISVLKSGKWGRLDGPILAEFEKTYADLNGASHCLGVSSGTAALTTILGALGIGPGDEVVIPVYTFIATYNVVVLNYALPILVDTDIETFQMDVKKAEAAVTAQTKAIMPVHIGGTPADIDALMRLGEKTGIPIIEDACQAHLAEWKGKKVGNFGLAGAFSFQSSKNLNCAEGGAVLTNDAGFARTCYTFHNQGQGGTGTSYGTGLGTRATNLRLTEFQGSLLLAQMTRLQRQVETRTENANYLTELLADIPGIEPAKWYPGTTRSAYHLYMFRYLKEHFHGLSRGKFVDALNAEGIPCDPGYGQMNRDAYVTGLASNSHYLRMYGEKAMKEWLERNQCPQNDTLTGEQSLWFFQTMLLGTRENMEQIAEAIRKIQKYAKQIAKA
ncbi:DegT/DnrJ/EryC1/StrS family aminotransferase [Parapedobacter indicus]|uniref:dTDP-4-amino-4,6-dideoxygalactose transaminase n=1 Tax=Parapedobacter indicus TaxID=1477437 RepID=A0A1I3NCA8_9SPHI|nr:DegT/DnrJ/EryC1/StrS family aminotransferase [Parapedobacter indicus]PPL00935.1 dTDP-4-amino-4,6-dideoxygalactose transaminase [Parapedobacter indicus]SFJ06436.1 dTDP-4-amino-4,6-dideoxygalactose transaminase [Parapedobacter indicus]